MLLPARMMQEVLVRLPQGFDPAESYPLLVMLHGHGGTAAGLHARMARYGDRPVIQAFPEGSYPALFGNGLGFSWYYPTRDRAIWEAADGFSLENVVETIKALERRFKIEKAHVFGFSQGASLACLVGLKNPALIGGIAAVGGGLPQIGGDGSMLSEPELDAAKSVPIFLARGRSDELAKKAPFDKQKDFLSARGFRVTAMEYEGAHFLADPLLDRLFRWILEDAR